MKKVFKVCYILIATWMMMISAAFPIKAEETEDSVYKFSIYGFVRNDFTFDSRKTMGAVGELFSFLPYDRKLAADGTDENAIATSRFLAVTTRMGFDVASPVYRNGFNIKAKIEADFCGGGKDIYYVRIRQAYTTLKWGNQSAHSLQVGQAWHPLTLSRIPNIVSLNTGTPFNPFSRAPQLRYDFNTDGWTASAAAIYQLQYTSPGPLGNAMDYQKQGLPELYIGVRYARDGFEMGVGGEWMQITPRCYVETAEGTSYKVNEKVRGWVGQLDLGWNGKNLSINAKTTFGQNMGHVLMLSGYAETGIEQSPYSSDPLHTRSTYTPLTQSASWLNIAWKTTNPRHNIITQVFAGYMQNFGTLGREITGKTYVRGFDNIANMGRVAPSIRYNYRDLCVGLEYEWTGVNYGETEKTGIVTDTHLISNHRIYAMLVYNFRYGFKK